LPFSNRGEYNVIFADATPGQVGVVIAGAWHVKRISAPFIFEAEAQAVELAIDLSPYRAFLILNDNAALVYALQKGRSDNLRVNTLAKKVLALRLSGLVINFKWIPTDENLADAPSRFDIASPRLPHIIVHNGSDLESRPI